MPARADRDVRPEAGQSRPALRGETVGRDAQRDADASTGGQRRPAKGRTEASCQRQDRVVLPYGWDGGKK